MRIFERLIQNVANFATTPVSGNSLDDAIKKGTIEGIHRAFENRASENCDGKDNPDERCPQKSGKCICAYVHWRQLPEWKQKLAKKPPRPSEKECFEAIVKPIIEELLARKAEKENV